MRIGIGLDITKLTPNFQVLVFAQTVIGLLEDSKPSPFSGRFQDQAEKGMHDN
jgi:hypothetical protein